MNNNTKSKSSKKITIIIVLVTIIVIAVAAVGGYFAYEYMEEKKPIEQEWANTYYNYIKEQNNEETGENKIQNNSKIGFVNITEVENPVMIVEYKKEEKTYTDIYYINEGTVKNIIDLGISDVELLYNINEKEYNWYTHKETDTSDEYEKVSNRILEATENDETNSNVSKDEGYTFAKGEEISVDTVDGDKISMPKFDTVFVKTDVEIDKVDYDKEMTDKELKNSITEEAKNYKNKDELITEEVKNEVTNKENESKEKVNKIEEEKVKKEEQDKKKAEEEARKKAEEEAAKGLQVGNYTLKYGTYKGIESQYDVGGVISTEITIVLKQDGTYNLKSSNVSLVPNTSGTYKVEKNSYTGVLGTHILKLSSGGFYAVTANNTLQVPAGSGVTFTYQGN